MRDALARTAVSTVLSRGVSNGRIEVIEAGRRRGFGRPDSDLRATVVVNDPAAWRGALHGSLGLGETYVEGHWETDDLVSLIRIAARELGDGDGLRGAVIRARGALHRARRLVPENTRTGARKNISAHYDLGNELFSAFLDERMMYSCAFFPRPDASLEEAQTAKLERICEQLRLGPDNHLLEIGTGWGGLAVHAAREHGCRVTTTTISREQHALATQRVREGGLEGQVTVLLRDYRDLEGTYDRLVSVEMIEAVGWQYFDEFFRCCDRLLSVDGLMLLQAITIDDGIYEMEKASRSFANTYIFPGGCLPSKAKIADCLARVTSLREVWVDDITAHYPPTLAAWRERFYGAWDRLRPHGYDERFRRLWEFYLSSSEAGFRERRIGDVQALFAKPGVAVSDDGREPLVLIHGLGASSSVWDPVVGLLAPEREVIALDLPGFGAAPALPPGLEPSAANMAATLHAELERREVERPHVAGNSLGAWVGLKMGRAGWATSVTALSPAGLWRAPLGPRRRDIRPLAKRLRPLVATGLRIPRVRRRALATFSAHPDRIPASAGRELVLGWIDSSGYDGANRAMRSHIFDPSGYPEDVPVTIAWAEHDHLVGPPKPNRRPAQTRFLVLPGVGHTPMWDDPELIARVLLEGSAAPAPAA